MLASYVRPLRQDLVIKFKVAVTFMVNSLHRIAQGQTLSLGMYTALEPVNPNTWTGWQDLVETRDNADSGATTFWCRCDL